MVAAAAMVLVATLIHGLGLIGVSTLFRLEDERLRQHAFDVEAVLLMGAIGLALFGLHLLEILAYSSFYLLVGAFEGFEAALFYSAASYTTLGYPAEAVEDHWRLLVASEAVVGFLMLGWSTAFLVRNIDKLRE